MRVGSELADTLKVNEIFGPTVQGEGAAAGRHCLFVRLANCNLECRWCDTAYTWSFSPEKAHKLDIPRVYSKADNVKTLTTWEVINELEKLWKIRSMPTIIVFSGGEPMMQARKLGPLCAQLARWGNEIHVETAGTLMLNEGMDYNVTQYNVSPKLGNSGNPMAKRFKPDVLRRLVSTNKAWFKFVIVDPEDISEVDNIVDECHIPRNRVQLMPEGTTYGDIVYGAQNIIEKALERGYGLTLRQHITIWGNKRGV